MVIQNNNIQGEIKIRGIIKFSKIDQYSGKNID